MTVRFQNHDGEATFGRAAGRFLRTGAAGCGESTEGRVSDEQQGRSLVFSVALNGYQWVYRRNIRTHRAYAEKFKLDYALVESPAVTGLLMECCWVKLPLMMSALAAGYDWVFYIDADAEIKSECPDFRTLAKPERFLYMAHGFSARVNSGVIIARDSPEVRGFFATVMRGFDRNLPAEDDVGWGENGHVIHFSRNLPFLEVIPSTWNNNRSPELADYVRHYSAGPMRPLYKMSASSKAIPYVSRLVQRMANRLEPYRYSPEKFPERLMELYLSCVKPNHQYFRLLPKSDIFGLT
jgi:hypothetical protein